jgi:hypothetical protein
MIASEALFEDRSLEAKKVCRYHPDHEKHRKLPASFPIAMEDESDECQEGEGIHGEDQRAA